jgi:hypothetical protein
LGSEWFSDCKSLSFFTFETGSRLVEIPELTFPGSSSLQSICIPGTVRLLGRECFYGCSSLSSIFFDSPSELETIEWGAFWECEKLESLSLPASPTLISGGALGRIKHLTFMAFEPGCKLSLIVEGSFSHRSATFSFCVPKYVEVIGRNCFVGVNHLTSVTFESGSKLREIEDNAFCGCSDLKSIFLSASLSKIHGSAFVKSSIEIISVEQGNPHCFVRDDFLMESKGPTFVRYFGRSPDLILGRDFAVPKVFKSRHRSNVYLDQRTSFLFIVCPVVLNRIEAVANLPRYIFRLLRGRFNFCSEISRTDLFERFCWFVSPHSSQIRTRIETAA